MPRMLSIFLLLTSLVLEGIAWNQCTSLDQLTSVQQGRRLTANTFLVLEIEDVMGCARACLNRKRCKSFNLLSTATIGQCELNLNTSSETGTLTSHSQFMYSDIDQWSKAVSGECESHTCSYNQMCQTQLSPLCPECSSTTQCGVCYPVTKVSNRQFTSLGCYKSESRPVLPHTLADLSPLDYTNVTKTVLQCATTAAVTEYDYFGLGDYDVCYGGNEHEANFASHVPVADCGLKCFNGDAVSGYMFIYMWI